MEEIKLVKESEKRRKVFMIFAVITAVLIATVGVTYAALSYQREGDSNELIAGDIYMHYKGKNAGISIENALPSKTYDPKEYFEFTIDGKNTNTEKDIYYEILLDHGTQPEGRTIRIRDGLLKFRLTEQIGSGKETTVLNGASYEALTNQRIWVNKINRNTTTETTITYKLYMWISEDVKVGYDDEGEIQSDYTPDQWNNSVYGSIRVNVKGDFIEKEADVPPLEPEVPTTGDMIEKIKGKAYSNAKEVIMLDVTDKSNVTKCASAEACAEKEEVEYRYSGADVNNYITLTDNAGAEETWRIIGIFNDDEAGEYIKIVRDAVLPTDKIADYYTANGQKYKIKNSGVNAYWNRFEPSSSSEKNNWSTAGLQYWLNAEDDDTEGNKGYLSYLSSDVKEKLVSVKHYLGTVHTDSSGYVEDTPKEAYKHERDVESCAGGKGTSSNSSSSAIKSESSGCHVWAGNDATWPGKVSLMYPSDYGFTAADTNWTTKLGASSGTTSFRDITTSWAFSTMSDAKSNYSWLLSPASRGSYYAAYWNNAGFVGGSYYVYGHSYGVRPVLNLSSQTSLVGEGDGTKNNPYKIVE